MKKNPKKYKSIYRQEQVRLLYNGTYITVLISLLFALAYTLISIKHLHSIQPILPWISLVVLVALVRAGDAFVYFRESKETFDHDKYLLRAAISTLSAAAAWGGLFRNSFPLGPFEYELFILVLATGICSYAATTLSYHFGIVMGYFILLLGPVELYLLTAEKYYHSLLIYLTPAFLIILTIGARRYNKNYFENIRLKLEFAQKEDNLRNMKYAMDQHTIISTADVHGKITYANEKFLELSQYSEDEIIGEDHQIIISKEHPLRFYEKVYNSVTKGVVWRGQVANRARDGSIYWVSATVVPYLDKNHVPYQYTSIMTDITEAKLTEKKNIRVKDDALIRAEVAQILQGQQPLNERFLQALKAVCKLADLQKPNAGLIYLQQPDISYVELYVSHGNLPEEFLAQVNKFDLGEDIVGHIAQTGQLEIASDLSTDIPYSTKFSEIRLGSYTIPLTYNGVNLGVLFLYTDLNPSQDQDRKDVLNFIGVVLGLAIANESVRRSLKQARTHAEAMASAKSDFLANMSHEIRTPLNGVLGMLDLIHKSKLDSRTEGYVEIAQRSASTLLNVINDVLDISKIESGKLHLERIDFDIRKTIEDIADLFAYEAQHKNIELSVYIAPEIDKIFLGDVLRLQQVLNNLISNAVKFTQKGEVSIDVTITKKVENNSLLRFEIKDTGIGISPDQQALLFNAFIQADSSTSREFGGTGLGLSISRSLIEMMGGRIHIDSKLNKGATFWFELPLESKQISEDEIPSLEGLRILAIDDIPTNCFIISRYMENWGAHVTCETDPQEGLSALQKAHQNGTPFEILLLDMSMPKMDGQEVAAEIRKNPDFNNLKIILLSSMSLVDDMNQHEHFDLLLNKPIRQSYLHDAIRTIQERGIVPIKQASKQTSLETIALQGKVLFVDDNIVNQHVGREMLNKLSLDFDIVSDGKMALDSRKTGKYDVILLDCQMPIMDGFEATRQIRFFEKRTSTERITIIALTANAMQGDRETCLEVGMDDYLAKPYTLSGLYGTLMKWLPLENNSPDTCPNHENIMKNPIHHQAEIINEDKLSETKQVMGNNFNLIITTFKDSAIDNIEEMKRQRTAGDLVKVRNAIHTLKGSSGSLGLQRLYEYCKLTEEKYRENCKDFSDIDAEIEEITNVFEETITLLDHHTTEQEA